MSQEADITRMHAEWMERKAQIQLEHDSKIRNAESNFNSRLTALDLELRTDLEEARQTLTQERDTIFSQLDMVFQRRLKEKEGVLEERRSLRLDEFRKQLDGQRKELADILDKTIQEHEMDYFKIMRAGGSSLSRPSTTLPSPSPASAVPSAPPGATPQHRHQHHPQPSVPGRPPLQPAPAPAPVLAQPRQPPLQPNPQSRPAHPQFAMSPQHRMSQPTQLQAPRPFQPPQQPMARPAPGAGPGRPQGHKTAHQPGVAPPERRPLARAPTLPSQHPPTPPAPSAPSVSKQTLIAPAKQHHANERRQEQQQRTERAVERPVEGQVERPVERPAERQAERPVERQAERSVERPVERPAERQADGQVERRLEERPAERSAERSVERPVERPAERSAERSVERPVERPAEPQAEGPLKRPAERQEERPVEQQTELPVERSVEHPERTDSTEPLKDAPKSPSRGEDIVMVDSPQRMSAPPPPATRRSASSSASTQTASQAPGPSLIAVAPIKDDADPARLERRHSRRQSSVKDVSPAPADDSRPASRGRENTVTFGSKRRASSLSTPQQNKKARNDVSPPPLASLEKTHRSRRAPSSHPQWISFDEVYQNGKATFKHYIFDWPPGSGVYFIVKCDLHGVHFNNKNPVSGAAKHLNGKDHHHLTKDRKQAVDLLGFHVYDCTPELAAKHNEVVNEAFARGYKIFTQKDRYFREMYNPDGTPRSDAERAELAGPRRGPRGSIGPGKGDQTPLEEVVPVESPKSGEEKAPPVKEVKGVTDAIPGEIYYGYWTKNKMKYAVVVCGWGDQKCIGLPGKTLGQLWPTLLNRAPSCYKVNKQTREIEGWAQGYEDGGPLVHRRAYAVQFFDKSRGVAWLQARHLSPFLMDDPDRPDDLDHPFNQAREFYANLRGFFTFDLWKKAGAKHGPVTTEESSSEYNTPGELPPEDNPDHGEPDEEMDFMVERSAKASDDQDDDDYDPDQTEEEDVEMEDAPAPPPSKSSDREHRKGHINVSSKTVDGAESKSEGGSASALKVKTPKATPKPAPVPIPVDASSSVNEEHLFGRALKYLENKKALEAKEKEREQVKASKTATSNPADNEAPESKATEKVATSKPATPVSSFPSRTHPQSSAPAQASESEKASEAPGEAHAETLVVVDSQAEPAAEDGPGPKHVSPPSTANATGPVGSNGLPDRASSVMYIHNGSANGTPLIRSLNGTPTPTQLANGAISAPSTPKPISALDAIERWKVVHSRTTPAAQTVTVAEAPTKLSTAAPAAMAPAPVTRPSAGTGSPVVTTESTFTDTYFDIAGYSGVHGEWARSGNELARLHLNDGTGVAETDGQPVDIKVDPLLVVRVVLEPMGDKTNFYLHGTKGVLHKLVFVACTDSQGRLQQPRALGRKFLKWVRTQNPSIPMPGAGNEQPSRKSSMVSRTPVSVD